MKLKEMTDDELYMCLADEVGSLRDDVYELCRVVNREQRDVISDALDTLQTTLGHVLDAHAELVKRGLVK